MDCCNPQSDSWYTRFVFDLKPAWAKQLIARVTALEKKMGAVDDQFTELKTDLDDITAEQGALKIGITNLQATIATLNANIATLQANSTGLTAAQQTALAALVTEGDSAKTQADALVAQIGPQPGGPAGS
jgi:septal ring factor EnvC (AmiA/AmiB activator)